MDSLVFRLSVGIQISDRHAACDVEQSAIWDFPCQNSCRLAFPEFLIQLTLNCLLGLFFQDTPGLPSHRHLGLDFISQGYGGARGEGEDYLAPLCNSFQRYVVNRI